MAGTRQHLVAVALGSNLGDRIGNLCRAVRRLEEEGMRPHGFSSVYETSPWGFTDQPLFLNMVLLSSTRLPPDWVLSIFKGLEKEGGRVPGFRNGPRSLDLDLILFGDHIVRQPGLVVPHPRWRERSFVVRPMAEVCPGVRDPETGLTVMDVAQQWPTEPRDIRVFETREGFQKALKEWYE